MFKFEALLGNEPEQSVDVVDVDGCAFGEDMGYLVFVSKASHSDRSVSFIVAVRLRLNFTEHEESRLGHDSTCISARS